VKDLGEPLDRSFFFDPSTARLARFLTKLHNHLNSLDFTSPPMPRYSYSIRSLTTE
jgi:hypothetical protein